MNNTNTKTLEVTVANAIKAYNSADPTGKKMLSNLFPGRLDGDITTRVKTFEDLCAEAGENPSDYVIPSGATQRQIGAITAKKVQLITEMANEGWEADYGNSNQVKYEIIWTFSPGSGFSYDVCGGANASSLVGARLSFVSPARARWAAETFRKEFNEYLTKTPIKL